jgi:hypothetical protein
MCAFKQRTQKLAGVRRHAVMLEQIAPQQIKSTRWSMASWMLCASTSRKACRRFRATSGFAHAKGESRCTSDTRSIRIIHPSAIRDAVSTNFDSDTTLH